MSGPRRQRLEEIFTEASLVPASERTEFVRRSCNGDEQLCEDVLSLLAHHDDESTFLDHAELVGLTAAAARAEAEDTVLPPGTRIAGFAIGSVIGSGGMGVVYVAEQERPHRTVALKVMNRALRASGVLRRFELEAEVLGRLQHPGIAQVHEAGAADISGQPGGSRAQPYIAMELINGPPLDEFARRERLDSRQCLEIVARVCDAVHHAHQRGIIHRDLKPANILVDSSGQPKVLDFGVARDTAQTNTSMHTGAGQLIGTLAYMSPEQVLADPEGIDTRADVYALGVILYQLLTGRLPHQLDQKPLPEAARIIRDEEPSRPGTWDRILRGEIETIVLKALCKDRQRRYQSAADLAQDVRRFLDGRPIAAKDDSAFYVLRKQIRRHRGAFAAAAVMLSCSSPSRSMRRSNPREIAVRRSARAAPRPKRSNRSRPPRMPGFSRTRLPSGCRKNSSPTRWNAAG
jgi:serine/threonine protein kinase